MQAPTQQRGDLMVKRRSYLNTLKRWSLAFLGVLCVGLAVLGVILPGLPATIFLMAATYLFARSCPALERVLVRNRLFAPFHQYIDGDAEMPLRAKVITLLLIWGFSLSSCVLLIKGGTNSSIAGIIVCAAMIGTYFVIWRRVPRS